jgi:hypothetical protein
LHHSNCCESRMFQLLAHAVTPVPSFADIRQTQRERTFSPVDHMYVSSSN